METLIGIVLLLYVVGVVFLCWNLIRSVQLVGAQRTLRAVPRDARSWPSLDIVIPVKNEAENIGACIEAILAQDYPNTNIIVVNDRSTDDTAGVVRSIQDRHPEVRRVDIAELPPGLYGKPHAIHSIAGELTSDYHAFVDSDLLCGSACMTTLVDHLSSNKLDWVAAMGAPEVFGFWEKCVIPIFGGVVFAWYDPRKISDPEWDDAIGSGLMACRREAYQQLGGHGAVIDIYDEDSELIRIAKRLRQSVSFVMAPELYTQRHYGSFSRTVRGITRTFVGGIKTVPRLLLTINALSFVSHLPIAVLIFLGLSIPFGWAVPWFAPWWIAGGVHLIVSTLLVLMVFRTANVNRMFACLHPIGFAILIGICARSILHICRGEKIQWRGTERELKPGTETPP